MKQFLFFTIFSLSISLAGLGQSLQTFFYYARFNAPSGPYLEFYFSILGQTAHFVNIDSAKHRQATIDFLIVLKQDSTIKTFRKYNLHSPIIDSNEQRPNFIDVQRIPLPKGNYTLELTIKDANDTITKPYFYSSDIDLNYPQEKAFFSDIEYVAKSYIQKKNSPDIFSKNGYTIEPYVANFFPESLNKLTFYSELYNTDKLIADSSSVFLLRYYIASASSLEILPNYVFTSRQKAKSIIPILSSIDIQLLPSGDYILGIQAINSENKIIAQKNFSFVRSHPSLDKELATAIPDSIRIEGSFVETIPTDSLALYIRYLAPISNQVEFEYARNQLKTNEPNYMRSYFLSFWIRKDAKNPKKAWEKYLAQVKIVNKNYHTQIRQGFETDRGRIYLKYGRPDDIIFHYNEPSSYPYEIWQYYQTLNQSNVKFVFYDPSLMQSDFILLTSTARGEPHISNWQYYLNHRNTPISDPYKNKVDDYYGNKLKEDMQH
jgi:GWxTD domain-containing protein